MEIGRVCAISDRIPLPAGMELGSEAEIIIRHQFARASARSGRRDLDVTLSAKIVKMDADIYAAQSELDDLGMMIENKRWVQIAKPFLSAIDRFERRQILVFR